MTPMRYAYAERLAGKWLSERTLYLPGPCDHVRHYWRGVRLPCATPWCAEGSGYTSLRVPYRCCETSVSTDKLIRENWDGGWGWRLA